VITVCFAPARTTASPQDHSGYAILSRRKRNGLPPNGQGASCVARSEREHHPFCEHQRPHIAPESCFLQRYEHAGQAWIRACPTQYFSEPHRPESPEAQPARLAATGCPVACSGTGRRCRFDPPRMGGDRSIALAYEAQIGPGSASFTCCKDWKVRTGLGRRRGRLLVRQSETYRSRPDFNPPACTSVRERAGRWTGCPGFGSRESPAAQ